MNDYTEPKTEEIWCQERRSETVAYLEQQGVVHGEVGEWPAWHIAPYVSLWAIESIKQPGWIGWWVICGDIPTDYVSADNIKQPKEAIAAIANRWQEAAALFEQGLPCQEISIGSKDDWPKIAPLLKSRASILERWSNDAELWDDSDN